MKKLKIFFLSIIIIVAGIAIFVVYQMFFAPLPKQKVDFLTNIAPMKGELEKYTDTSFGFSFLYPKEWQSKMEIFPKVSNIFFGTGVDITIQEVNGRMDDTNSWLGHVVYYYDLKKKAWLVDSNTPDNVGLMFAEPIFYTDSGLPVFEGTGMIKTDIVALSPSKILSVNIASGGDTGSLDPFVKTISSK